MNLSNLNFNRVFVFYEVYRSGNLQLASQRLAITPSAVSQQLKKLEAELGVSLFVRTTRQIVPTEPGKRLFDYLQTFMKELPLVLQSLHAAKTEISGRIRITAPGVLGSTLLIEFLARFQQKYPLVKFALTQRNRPSEAIEDLLGNKTDIAIVDLTEVMERQYAIEIRPLIAEEEWMVGSREFVPRMGRSQTYETLAVQPFVTSLADGLAEKLWFQRVFDRVPLELDITLSTENLRGMVQAVKRGMGLALLPLHMVRDELKRKELQRVAVSGQRYLNRMGMANRSFKEGPPALTTFMAFLEAQFHRKGKFI